MDFYAIAWLSGFAFLGICLLCIAWSLGDLADAIRGPVPAIEETSEVTA